MTRVIMNTLMFQPSLFPQGLQKGNTDLLFNRTIF